MAAPTWVAAGTFQNSSGVGNVTPGLPAGQTTDDIFLLFVHTQSADPDVATPSGWTAIGAANDGGATTGLKSVVFWRRATASETAPTIAAPGSGGISAIVHAFRGCTDSGNPYDVSADAISGGSSTSISFPSVTTTVVDTMVVLFCAPFNVNVSGYSNANLSSLTERSDNGNSPALSIQVATGVKATAGSTGTTSATASFATAENTHTIALKSSTDVDKNDSDSGTGTESESVAVTINLSNSDSGTGTESQSILAADLIVDTDTGIGTESENVVKNDSPFDFVAMSDQLALKLILGLTDIETLEDLASEFDLEPTIGMSRPFTYDIGWKDIINKIEMTIEKRYPTFQKEKVWEDTDTKTIFPGESYVYKAKAEDPFYDAEVPVAGIKSFSGSDQQVTPEVYDFLVEEGTVGVSLSRTSGQSVEITVQALANTRAVISGMSLRAYPVKVAHTFYAVDKDVQSQELEGVKTPSDQEAPSGWSNFNDSKALMEIILNQRFKKLPFVTFSLLNANAIRLRTMLDLRLSDRVDIHEDETFTDDPFYLEQISHKISSSGAIHETMLGCEQIPKPISGAMIFDDPDLGFNVGVFGDRANTYNFDENLFILGQSVLDGERFLGL